MMLSCSGQLFFSTSKNQHFGFSPKHGNDKAKWKKQHNANYGPGPQTGEKSDK